MYTIPLEKIKKEHLKEVGNKAFISSILLNKEKIKIPKGFVITNKALQDFFEYNNLHKNIHLIKDKFCLINRYSETEIKSECENLTKKIRQAEFPPQILEQLFLSSENLLPNLVVRSSATVEDKQNFSFAGVFHSEINVKKESLLKSILKCWATFFDYFTLTQIMQKNINPWEIGIGLLVQKMISPDISGVLFTQDPKGENKTHGVISIVKGNSEDLMQGESSDSESYIFERKRKKIIKRNENKNFLYQKEIKKIIKKGIDIENRFKFPQDIEWGIKGKTIYFFQSRPITTIENPYQRPIIWTRELAKERYPQPISPLGWSIVNNILTLNIKTLANRFGLVSKKPEMIARTIQNYVYSNKEFFQISSSMNIRSIILFAFKNSFKFMKTFSMSMVYILATLFKKHKLGIKWGLLAIFFRNFIIPQAEEIKNTWDNNLENILKEIDAYKDKIVKTLTIENIWTIKQEMDISACRYLEADLAIYLVSTTCSLILKKMIKDVDSGVNFLITDLTNNIDSNQNILVSEKINELAKYIKTKKELKNIIIRENYEEAWQNLNQTKDKTWQKFLNDIEHLTLNWDIMESTWGEKPMEILQLVRNYLTTSNIKSNKNYKKTKEENYHQAHNKIINYLKDKQPSLIPFFEKVLSLLRTFIIIDNEQHFYASRLFIPTRQLLHLIGEILVSKNIIQNPKDIYFLTEPEIDELMYRDASFPRNYLIEKRKASFYRSKKKSPPDEFIDNFPIFKKNEFCQQEITIKKKDPQNSSWKGIGASPGITTGKIKKIETINQIHDFKGDEILVTTSPNPIWASVFPIVSGLISETGDILSHGLVLAREYNLPAVINIPNITKNLKDGQKVKIDGTQGLITLI